MSKSRREVISQKRNGRKGALFVKKDLQVIIPLTTTCQVCHMYDALNECDFCKRPMCVRDTFSCKKTKYCLECYNDENTHNVIMSIYMDEKKITMVGSIINKFLNFISFEWTRKKIEPYSD